MTQVAEILSLCTYGNWTFFYDDALNYLQVIIAPDSLTGELFEHSGRKWKLSPHMTKSEIVQTALLAVLQAEEHEARERFHYRGQAIFGPHFNVDQLALLCEQENGLDARMVGVGCGK